ncbi:restriction endonuclease subunit S [Bordetella avium]|uniref:restriction endonuclease subunit S n=1 Tax=Bordetella avium TaxID=521 RepID=UPI00057B2504|nr:restriction endonuclease subunit S [Bordetella avium]RIQ49448.1 restriction endonuclease subunit S [Bordetella avium]
MSDIDFLPQLLDGAEVDWKPLGEVLNRTKGTKITAGQMRELHKEGGPVKIFAGGKTVAFVNFNDIPEKDIQTVPSIIVKSRGIIEFEYYENPFTHKNEMWAYNAKDRALNIKYVYHFLKLNEPHFHGIGSKMQMPQIAIPDTDGFSIPIPCPNNPKRSLEIQAEIVRILDAFTELTAELSAELSARKKQYNYYRDQLLSFGEGVPFLSLAQCCESIADGDHQAPQKTEDGIPFITISNVSATNQIDFSNTKFVSNSYYDGLDSKRKARTNDILYTVVGSFGIPVHIDCEKKFAFQRHIAILRPNPAVVLSKYMYHALRSSAVEKQAHKVAAGAAQKTITLSALNRMLIAVPSLEEQARIVAILDKFDVLTNSIAEGLPREIELRKKQYKHYRDLLLSFPKPEEVEA